MNMGSLSELEDDDRKVLANRIENLYLGNNTLFVDISDKIETLAVRFYKELRNKYKQSTKDTTFQSRLNNKETAQSKDMESVIV